MKKRILSIFGLLAFVIAPLFAVAEGEDTLPRPDPAVAEFTRAVKFSVAGYDTEKPALTNFPVLVRLSDDSPRGFHYTDMMYSDTGSDLCFVDMDGTPLAFEIDTNAWTKTGTSHIWVTLPVMTNNAEFVMCYRCTTDGAGALVSDANAWTNFVGVWHMGERGNGAVTVYDSTPNQLHGTANSKSSAQVGPLGGARQITSVYNKEFGSILVSLSGDKLAAVNALGTEFTVSFWMKSRRTSQGWMYLIGRKADDSTATWALQTGDAVNEIRMFVKGGNDGVGRKSAIGAEGLYNGKWHKVDAVYKSTKTFDFYWDGVKVSDNAALPDVVQGTNGTFNLAIGGHTSGASSRSLYGDMDEVRLRCGTVDGNWVAATYSNECSAAFLTSGEVESFGESAKPVAAFSLDDFGAAYAKFSGSVSSIGGSAESATAYLKLWPTASAEPDWTMLQSGLVDLDPVARISTGLDTQTPYSYKFKITNNLGKDSEVISGTFETAEIGVPGTGGSIVFYNEDVIHTFWVEEGETEFEFSPPSYVSSVQALVVGGGGAGGYYLGGGGGAGGFVYNAALDVTGDSTYVINVGTGGLASASASVYGGNGGDSSIKNGSTTLVSATGGGAGGNGASDYAAGVAGGSGGGAAFKNKNAGTGSSGKGNSGGKGSSDGAALYAGGGGGAGAAGSDGAHNTQQATSNGGKGGDGLSSDISGETIYYAGGGGGGGTYRRTNTTYSTPAGGGDGGGGRGGQESNIIEDKVAASGMDGLGGGGGGGSAVLGFEKGGNGGNGVVIIRYSMKGVGSGIYEPIVSMTGATYNDADATADVGFNVVWAGDGFHTVNVSAIYGYSEDNLVYTNANIATDVIGKGTGMVSLPRVSKKVYVRLIATNAGSHTGVSADVKSFVLVNPKAPAATVSATPGITTANLVADVTDLGQGATSVNGVFQICADESFAEGTYTTFAATGGPLAEAGALTGRATDLLANTVYWFRAILTNDVITAGEPEVFETDPVLFLTDRPDWPSGVIQPSNDNPEFSIGVTSISAEFNFNSLGEGGTSGSAWMEVSTTHDEKNNKGEYTQRFETGLVASSAVTNVVAADIPAICNFTVEGLEPDTAYYVRYRVRNNGGRETSNDKQWPFTTLKLIRGMLFLIY